MMPVAARWRRRRWSNAGEAAVDDAKEAVVQGRVRRENRLRRSAV